MNEESSLARKATAAAASQSRTDPRHGAAPRSGVMPLNRTENSSPPSWRRPDGFREATASADPMS
jgi:hypothetical protein